MITIIKNIGLIIITLLMLIALFFMILLVLYIVLASIRAIVDEFKDFLDRK